MNSKAGKRTDVEKKGEKSLVSDVYAPIDIPYPGFP